jgi:hypothetical protein
MGLKEFRYFIFISLFLQEIYNFTYNLHNKYMILDTKNICAYVSKESSISGTLNFLYIKLNSFYSISF